MYLWIIYGLLCTPGAFALPGALDLAKFAIAEGFNTPVFKDVSLLPFPRVYGSLNE